MLRPSRYLRISITNRCNLSCRYCHQEGYHASNIYELQPMEIETACKAALEMGFHKFKLTGGEPTMRNDLCEIITRLARLELPDLSMITNGILLSEQAGDIWRAGLRRLNITLNTLNQSRFQDMQTAKAVSVFKVLEGIESAKSVGFQNIKLNFVYRGIDSRQDLEELLQYARESGLILVVLPIIGEQFGYVTLDDLYFLMRNYGIESEHKLIDAEGISKILIRLSSGTHVLLRCDELAQRKPYVFCNQCVSRSNCREGIFPIRLSAGGDIIPCMASNENRITIRSYLARGDIEQVKKVFSTINGWYSKSE